MIQVNGKVYEHTGPGTSHLAEYDTHARAFVPFGELIFVDDERHPEHSSAPTLPPSAESAP